jgi:hypothetical protein
MAINKRKHNQNLYEITIIPNAEDFGLVTFKVYASNETEAEQKVADYIVSHELKHLYYTHFDLVCLADFEETIDHYTLNHGLSRFDGGIYIEIAAIDKIETQIYKWQSCKMGNIVETFSDVVRQMWESLVYYHTLDIKWKYNRNGF